MLYGEDTFAAIEVKRAAKVERRDLAGLRAFGEDYPEAQRALLYFGRERVLVDGITVMPCTEFLAQLHPQHPLPVPSPNRSP